MQNKKKTADFVFRLYELVVDQKFSVSDGLDVISRQSGRKNLKEAGIYVKKELENGNGLSGAFRRCPFLNFDEIFLTFISFAEKTGFINPVLKFLKEREERRKKFLEVLLEACVYPGFVIILTLGLCVFLVEYGEKISGSKVIGIEKIFNGIIFLSLFCIFSILLLKKLLSENPVYEAFLAISLLLKSGIKTTAAVGLGILVTGEASAAGLFLTKARMNLEYGMGLFRAFNSINSGRKLLGDDGMEMIYFGARGGNEWEIFEKIAIEMKKRDEKRRRLVLTMLEPVVIGITGIFLMFILCDFIVPLTNGFNLEF